MEKMNEVQPMVEDQTTHYEKHQDMKSGKIAEKLPIEGQDGIIPEPLMGKK